MVNKRPRFPENTAATAMLLKKRPIIQPENTMEKTWRKPTENPRSNTPLLSREHKKIMEKTQGPTRPCYLENPEK